MKYNLDVVFAYDDIMRGKIITTVFSSKYHTKCFIRVFIGFVKAN